MFTDTHIIRSFQYLSPISIASFSIFSASILAFIVRKLVQCRKDRQFALLYGCLPPPHANPYDFLGLRKMVRSTISFINQEALVSTAQLHTDLGDTYSTRVLSSNVIFTSNPENIRRILVTRFSDFESGPIRAHLFRPLTEHGIFTVDGPEWKVKRHLYRNHAQFSNLRIITDVEMLETHIQDLFQHIPSSSPFNLHGLFGAMMLDVTAEFVLGSSTNSLTSTQSEETKEFAKALIDVQQRIANGGFLGPAGVLMKKAPLLEECAIVHRYVEKHIDIVLARPVTTDGGNIPDQPQRYTMLESLSRHTRDRLELRDSATTILIAGVETMTSLLSSVFFLLSRNQVIFHKLRNSILEPVGHRPPSFSDLKKFPYLRCVINEALRLYPPVAINARMAVSSSILPTGGGLNGKSPIHIGKGQKVIFSSFATHRSTTVWGPDALDFKPERWEKGDESMLGLGGGYFPFLLGPRSCPGQQYALLEATYFIVRIMQEFKSIKSRDDRPWKEHMGLNLRNENGCWVELVRDEENES